MLLGRKQTFRAGSPVGVYWLSRCEGFVVEGREGETGVVEEIVFLEPRRPAAYVVVGSSRLLGRPRAIAVGEIADVDPWNRRLRLRGSIRACARRSRRQERAAPVALDGR